MDWLDLLAVQGTRKSLLQHHSSKASILQHSAFFIVQLSHPYMTTGKTIALTRWFHHFMANRCGNSGNSDRLLFWAPKSLQMVTAAMKLKDTYSLEEKLDQPRQLIKKQRHYFANKGPSSQSYSFSSSHV